MIDTSRQEKGHNLVGENLEDKVDFTPLIDRLRECEHITAETIENSFLTFDGLVEEINAFLPPFSLRNEKWGMFFSMNMVPLRYQETADRKRLTIGIKAQKKDSKELRDSLEIGMTIKDGIAPYLELGDDVVFDYILLTEKDFLKLREFVKDEQIRRDYLGEFDAATDARRAFFALVSSAVKLRASDIHIEPGRYESGAEKNRVRYRVDGSLREEDRIPGSRFGALVNVAKVLTRSMKVEESHIPQDGTIKFEEPDILKHPNIRGYELRVSTLPGLYGEKVALRLLQSQGHIKTLEELGYLKEECREIREISGFPQGIVLFTGPTGSGKTSTLYSILSERNTKDVNIVTIEDPIEVAINGVNQTTVNRARGYGFDTMLRTAMRQDPDIILVGEIRDKETADLAMQAAQTGHLVFSTLHTNEAVSSLRRLYELGVDSSILEDSLIGVVSQRLAKKLCLRCREKYDAREELNALFREEIIKKPVCLFRARGKIERENELGRGTVNCPDCNEGYVGRTVVPEIWVVGEDERDLMAHGERSPSQYFKSAVASGMKPLVYKGLARVLSGNISLDELTREVVKASDFRRNRDMLLGLIDYL